jgi:cell fate regulator YaaT (PSP1 superfamily)
MTEIIGVRFKKVGKVYYFDPDGNAIEQGQRVIVETSRGVECGETVIPNRMVEDDSIVQPLKKLIRAATKEDLERVAANEQLEKDAFDICVKKIEKHGLAMKLVAVEYTFDNSKILFYFTADGRVDFRDLVKDLASVFRTRIELRQIGVRDAAKMVGGLGICGCPLCCATFLDDFQPVSINMAKDQGLSLNPSKISGTCGRLMCCLKYENEAYQDLIKVSPTPESLVDTPKGKGTVMDVSLLKGCCRVRLQSNPDSPETFPCEQCKILRRGKAKNQEEKKA